MFWAVIGSGYLKSSPSYDLLANCYGFYSNNAVVNAKFNKDRYSSSRYNFGTYASRPSTLLFQGSHPTHTIL